MTTTMKKVGIGIDKWKLPIFEKHLRRAGYTWDKTDGLAPDVWFLRVDTDDVDKLGVVVKAANDECGAA